MGEIYSINWSLQRGVDIYQGFPENFSEEYGIMTIVHWKSDKIEVFEMGNFKDWEFPWNQVYRQGRFSIFNPIDDSTTIYNFRTQKHKIVQNQDIENIYDEQYIGNGQYMI